MSLWKAVKKTAGKVFNVERIEKVGKIPHISSSLSENQTGDKGYEIFPTKVSVAKILKNVNENNKKYVLGTEENAEHQKELRKLQEERKGKNGEVQTVYNINRINQLNKKRNTAKVRGSIPETGTPQGGVSNENVSQQNKKVNTQDNKNLNKPDTAMARAMEKAKADKRQYSFRDETESYTKSDKQRIDALGGRILNEFKKLTGAAKYEDYKELKSLAKEAAWEYAEYKDLSLETRIRLFNNLWDKAVEVDKKYYEENKEIKKLIREKLV